jgi:hypothetical protein
MLLTITCQKIRVINSPQYVKQSDRFLYHKAHSTHLLCSLASCARRCPNSCSLSTSSALKTFWPHVGHTHALAVTVVRKSPQPVVVRTSFSSITLSHIKHTRGCLPILNPHPFYMRVNSNHTVTSSANVIPDCCVGKVNMSTELKSVIPTNAHNLIVRHFNVTINECFTSTVTFCRMAINFFLALQTYSLHIDISPLHPHYGLTIITGNFLLPNLRAS